MSTSEQRSWGKVTGVGPKTAMVITQAMAGEVPDYLQKLRDDKEPLTEGGLAHAGGGARAICTCHSTWSDGGSPLEEMMITARTLGHEYCAITDHSPRLKVARGLTAERLREQLEVVRDLNEVMAPFRCLQGIEVDILEDGGLDQDRRAAGRARRRGGQRALQAAVGLGDDDPPDGRRHRQPADQRARPLHGRLIEGERGTRPQSVFDAEVVFEACRTFDVAVEINSRPERRDPPDRAAAAWPSRWVACSPSTPTPMRPASWSSRSTAASGPRTLGTRSRPGDQHLAGGPAAGVLRKG